MPQLRFSGSLNIHRAPRRCGRAVAMVLLIAATNVAQATVPTAERQALQNLYTSTNGGSWSNSTGWNGPMGTECGWFGVTCDPGQTHVEFIQLASNGLSGTLPSLNALQRLQIFDREQRDRHRQRGWWQHPVTGGTAASVLFHLRQEPADRLDTAVAEPRRVFSIR
jgi:Leucine rich repeat N-terminal domain